MDDQQLLRYSRHILLPEIGIEGQRLLDMKALIAGLGLAVSMEIFAQVKSVTLIA